MTKPSEAPIEKGLPLLMQPSRPLGPTSGQRVNWEEQLRVKTRGRQQQVGPLHPAAHPAQPTHPGHSPYPAYLAHPAHPAYLAHQAHLA